MLILFHAGLGWVVGLGVPGSHRRARIWCTLAALLPDLDSLSFFGGKRFYDSLHPALGHNLLVGALWVGAAGWAFRRDADRMWLASMAGVAAAFALHLMADLVLLGWTLELLWPVLHRGIQISSSLNPGHPFTRMVESAFLAVPWILAFWRKVTPLEILSPGLDDLFLSLFRAKRHECSVCKRKCNHRCRGCTKPICLRHGKIGRRFRLTCPACRSQIGPKADNPELEAYLARELDFVRSKDAFRLDPEFAAFLDRKLSDGLKRLDAIPRTNPLWGGSNHQPTMAKLAELCKVLLQTSPDDDEARWVLFADLVHSGSADLGYSALEPLILRDLGSLRWLMSAARWSYVLTGLDPVVSLAGSFEHLSTKIGPVKVRFQDLQNDLDHRNRETARQCLELLEGRNPFRPPKPSP